MPEHPRGTAFEPIGPNGSIPVVLAIDVEPDGKPHGRRDPIRVDGLAATVAWLDGLRPRLEAATGQPANVAWFVRMDPQIEAMGGHASAIVDLARPWLDRLVQRGDGIGLHTHGGRWDEAAGSWLVDHGDPGWMEHCTRTAFDAFATAFGAPCRQHRFGDRWSSPEALDLVAGLGATVDLTAEPGRRGEQRVDLSAPATGMVPSYLSMRSVPQPHRDSSLWLLPLTAGDPGPALPPIRRAARRLRFVGQPRHRPLQLDRAWRSPEAYWSVMERTLAGLPAPYIAWAVRSDLVLEPAFAVMRAILDALPSRALARRLQFTDAVAAIEQLRVPAA